MKKRGALSTSISVKIISALLCEDEMTAYKISKAYNALSYQHRFREARDRLVKGKFIGVRKKKKGYVCYLKYGAIAKQIIKNIKMCLDDRHKDRSNTDYIYREIKPLKKHIKILERVLKTPIFRIYFSRWNIQNRMTFGRAMWEFVRLSTENVEMNNDTKYATSAYFEYKNPPPKSVEFYEKSYPAIKHLKDIYYLYYKR